MQITQRQYKKWVQLAKVVTSGDDYLAEELLSNLLESILVKTPEKELTDDFIFISLKNRFLNHIRDEKVRKKRTDKYLIEQDNLDETDYLDIKEKELIMQTKLNNIVEIFQTLNQIEKKLYYLHYILGYTQTYIAKEIGVQYKTVNDRIGRIKIKIKKHYENNQQ
jgi:RNA polymerase sigma factor (sigma-70 family)